MEFSDSFDLLEYRFSKTFETESSVSYDVSPIGGKGLGSVTKWLEVHYPCSGHIKAQIRGTVSVSPTEIKSFVDHILVEIGLPPGETFQLNLFDAENVMSMSQAQSTQGESDRIETTRRFDPPT